MNEDATYVFSIQWITELENTSAADCKLFVFARRYFYFQFSKKLICMFAYKVCFGKSIAMQTSVGNEQCIVDILQALLPRDAACQLKSC